LLVGVLASSLRCLALDIGLLSAGHGGSLCQATLAAKSSTPLIPQATSYTEPWQSERYRVVIQS
jgi:hypothetical protein